MLQVAGRDASPIRGTRRHKESSDGALLVAGLRPTPGDPCRNLLEWHTEPNLPNWHRERLHCAGPDAHPSPAHSQPQAAKARAPMLLPGSAGQKFLEWLSWFRRCKSKPKLQNYQGPSSWSPEVPISFDLLPIKATTYLFCPLPDPFAGCAGLLRIRCKPVWNKPSHRPSMPGYEDFFALLYSIQQGAQCVLRFKCADLNHKTPVS